MKAIIHYPIGAAALTASGCNRRQTLTNAIAEIVKGMVMPIPKTI
jgi:hypothetical protein